MSNSKIWHPYTPGIGGTEILIDRANGSWLYTKDGRKILDVISSWWVNLHGHAHPKIAQAIANQATKLEQVIFAGFSHEPAELLAEQLLPKLPGSMSRMFFSDNGSTAIEVALKLALQYFHIQGENRTRIVALENAYHGDTFGAMAVGGRGPFSAAFRDWLVDVDFVVPPYSTSIHGTVSPAGELELKRAEAIFSVGNVAALIVEPLLQGSGGMLIYPVAWLNQLFDLARKYGVLIISDEVFTGFFRTGKPFSTHHATSQPDIICLSKGITGGFLPLGVTACSELVSEPFHTRDYDHTFYHGHSFTANPLACAAALASLQLTESEDFLDSVKRLCDGQLKFVNQLNGIRPELAPRCIGSISALTLQAGDGVQYTHPLRQKIYSYFIDKGLLLRPIGNVMYTVPPYCTTSEEMDWVYGEILDFLDQLD